MVSVHICLSIIELTQWVDAILTWTFIRQNNFSRLFPCTCFIVKFAGGVVAKEEAKVFRSLFQKKNVKYENMMEIMEAKLETAWHKIGTEVNLWDQRKLISI